MKYWSLFIQIQFVVHSILLIYYSHEWSIRLTIMGFISIIIAKLKARKSLKKFRLALENLRRFEIGFIFYVYWSLLFTVFEGWRRNCSNSNKWRSSEGWSVRGLSSIQKGFRTKEWIWENIQKRNEVRRRRGKGKGDEHSERIISIDWFVIISFSKYSDSSYSLSSPFNTQLIPIGENQEEDDITDNPISVLVHISQQEFILSLQSLFYFPHSWRFLPSPFPPSSHLPLSS